MRRQQMLGHFREKVERHAAPVIRAQLELRLDQLASVQADQLGIFALEIGHLHLGQRSKPEPNGLFGGRALRATPRISPGHG